ncbi:RNA polymerase sigma factor [Polyangium aurulentum]|uniref:RNA polymerase sigma factor n=1 Tax=Polyangium aurulentum TaxID=2567896 RepID=UPI0010AEAF8F|nr:RNA polymerase sigma factor [Polyangium aurulentum]UQA55734.1 RNA polymerase sigma factor [Polyangium aurulentum]
MITLPVCPRPAKIPTDLPASPSSPAPPSEPPSKRITRLYTEERSFIRNLVLRRGVPARDADDVVHEVFLVVCRRIADLDPTHTARPWLHVITVQVAANYRKRARHHRERLPGVLPDQPDQRLDTDEIIASHEERAHFRARLARLRPKLRSVVIPYTLEERPISEIAITLDIPEPTAYARLHLARAALVRRKATR